MFHRDSPARRSHGTPWETFHRDSPHVARSRAMVGERPSRARPLSGPLPEGSRGGLLPDLCFRRVQYSTLCLGATPLSSLHHHHWGANLSADAGTRSRRSTGTPVGDVPLGTPHRDVPQGLQREPLTGSGDVLCRKPRGPVGCRAPDLPPERWFWGSAPEPACLRAVGQHHSHAKLCLDPTAFSTSVPTSSGGGVVG